jgi:hypothetical protein
MSAAFRRHPVTVSLAASAALAFACVDPAAAPAEPSGERPALRVALGGMRADAAQLRATDRVAVPGGGAIHRFNQRSGGLPVLGAEAVIAAPAAGPARVVVDRTVRAVSPEARRPTLSRRDAVASATQAHDVAALRAAPRTRLGIDPASSRIAWEVRLAAARPLGDLVVRVDARTGRVLRSRDLLRTATASATLFDPNPVVTQGGYTGLRDNRDRDSAQLAALRKPVALERMTGAKGCLRGRYVDVRLGRRANPVCKRSLDFSGVDRERDVFEALMAYFHIDRARFYIDSLGLSERLRLKPQRVRANGIAEDNSYFSPFQRAITLGTGGVDDGEDADVIVHEYGHSVQDQARRFFGESLEGAAIGEGFGDYLAAAMSAQVTGGDARFDPCMFEWDAVSYTSNRCARRTDRGLTKPQANRRCHREPHCVGEAWASALWELRAALGSDPAGRSIGDRVVMESNFMLARTSGFRDGARALIAADQLLYGGEHAAAIEAEMMERRFCKPRGC